jgi:hypothetical protein
MTGQKQDQRRGDVRMVALVMGLARRVKRNIGAETSSAPNDSEPMQTGLQLRLRVLQP